MPLKKPPTASSSFAKKVRAIVTNIPPGTVMTYKAVAMQAGNAKAARAVARLMSQNYDVTIPCHRVIRSDGRPGGYNRGGEEVKLKLLRQEGWGK